MTSQELLLLGQTTYARESGVLSFLVRSSLTNTKTDTTGDRVPKVVSGEAATRRARRLSLLLRRGLMHVRRVDPARAGGCGGWGASPDPADGHKRQVSAKERRLLDVGLTAAAPTAAAPARPCRCCEWRIMNRRALVYAVQVPPAERVSGWRAGVVAGDGGAAGRRAGAAAVIRIVAAIRRAAGRDKTAGRTTTIQPARRR